MHKNTKRGWSFWSRPKPPEPTIIVINDVTYRSPQDMPEDALAIWHANSRQLEQRGIDWREQKRIVLFWRRDGNSVRQGIRIEGRPQFRRDESKQWSWVGAAWIVYVMCWVALSMYGLFGRRPPLVFASASVLLKLSFGLLTVPWIPAAMNVYRKRQRVLAEAQSGTDDIFSRHHRTDNVFQNPDTPTWKVAGTTLIGMAGLLLTTYYAAFGGVAKLLHHVESEPGEAIVTIAAKHTHSTKNARCVPRIEFDGFRHMGSELCMSADFFNRVQVGDRIRMTGRVSRYAIEPYDLEAVAPDEGVR